MSFFARADVPSPQAFSLFGAQHIALLLFLAGCIAAGLYILNRLSPQGQKRMIYSAAILEPALALSHPRWTYSPGTTAIV